MEMCYVEDTTEGEGSMKTNARGVLVGHGEQLNPSAHLFRERRTRRRRKK